MANPKKNTPSAATAATPAPALPPEAQVTLQPLPDAAAVPAKLPARKRVSVKKPAIKKAAVEKPVQAEAVQKNEKAAPSEKIKKPKLVRDSFTIPKTEYVVLDELKQRATLLTRPIKKSELLRAGIKLLAALPDAQFLDALSAVPAVKTGRPVLEK